MTRKFENGDVNGGQVGTALLMDARAQCEQCHSLKKMSKSNLDAQLTMTITM